MKRRYEIRWQETREGWLVAVLFIIQQQWSDSTGLHSCFIWNGMLFWCWTSRKKKKKCFSTRCFQDVKKNLTIVNCNFVEKKHLWEACMTSKIWSILHLHINESNNNNSEMAFTLFCCASWITAGDEVALSVQWKEWLQSLWVGQGQKWKDYEFYMLHIINIHNWGEKRQQFSCQYPSMFSMRGGI